MREKLIELISCADFHPCKGVVATIGSKFTTEFIEVLADNLIANGVTFATDNNVGDKLSPAAYKSSATEWIPVTERLPEERKSAIPALGSYSRPVLVVWERKCTGDRFVREGYTREGVFVNKTYNDDIRATHWMPLPEPAEEVRE